MNPYPWLFACAVVLPFGSYAVSPAQVEYVRSVDQPLHAVALSAESRMALREWIDSVRGNKKLCRFEVAVVMGWASSNEGDFTVQRRLATMRAEYVAHQLLGISLPPLNTFISEGDVEEPLVSGAAPPQGVTVYIKGYPGTGDCTSFHSYTKDTTSNMRTRTATSAKHPRESVPAIGNAK